MHLFASLAFVIVLMAGAQAHEELAKGFHLDIFIIPLDLLCELSLSGARGSS